MPDESTAVKSISCMVTGLPLAVKLNAATGWLVVFAKYKLAGRGRSAKVGVFNIPGAVDEACAEPAETAA